jgi:hypothetical protein
VARTTGPPGLDEDEAAPAAPSSDRLLVVLDTRATETEALARGLRITRFEAAQLARRGAHHLVRIASPTEAQEQAGRLADAGCAFVMVPECEALEAARPQLVLGGGRSGDRFKLRLERRETEIAAGEILLLVHGPIARHYQTSWELKRVRSAMPEEGYRVHLHRKGTTRPLEIDPGAFEFGRPNLARSSLLQIKEWVDALGGVVPVDDDFRRVMPALGPSSAEVAGALGAVQSLSTKLSKGKEGPVILDNLPQFRFYSSWRAAVERRAR